MARKKDIQQGPEGQDPAPANLTEGSDQPENDLNVGDVENQVNPAEGIIAGAEQPGESSTSKDHKQTENEVLMQNDLEKETVFEQEPDTEFDPEPESDPEPEVEIEPGPDSELQNHTPRFVVVSSFRDINNFDNVYDIGDDVSHLDEKRIQHLMQKGLVDHE